MTLSPTRSELRVGLQVTVCDHYGIEQIVAAAEGADAATSPGTFTVTPGSGQEYVFRVREFIRYVNKGSNNIYKKTLRGVASYIVAGNDVATLISTLGGDLFKPQGDFLKNPPTGPVVIGTLQGRTVVQDPLVTDGRYYLGWKGDDVLSASVITAPYIPLFATQTITLSDLQSQKGFYSAVGYHVVNAGLLTYGVVAGM